MARIDELRREAEIAYRNARGADHAGDYQAAAYWEDRTQALLQELEELGENYGKAN